MSSYLWEGASISKNVPFSPDLDPGVFLRLLRALCSVRSPLGIYPSLTVSEDIGDRLGNQQMARKTL
jgi:hypothetical protein